MLIEQSPVIIIATIDKFLEKDILYISTAALIKNPKAHVYLNLLIIYNSPATLTDYCKTFILKVEVTCCYSANSIDVTADSNIPRDILSFRILRRKD